MASSRAERAAARAGWTFERRRLSEEQDELLRAVPPAACVAMVWALTLDAWATSGRTMPDYRRGDAPGRILRPRPA